MKYIRAIGRIAEALVAAPFMLGLAIFQKLFVGPVIGDYTAIPNIIYQKLRKIFGYKVEFNAASAPLVKDKRVWFLLNHMSSADIPVVGASLNGSFVGKSDIQKWPIIGRLLPAVNFISARRKPEFNGETRGKIAENFNAGFNTIMFPEATTGDGKKVRLFHAGLLTLLYGEQAVGKNKQDVTLNEKVVVQPVAIRVKSVNGRDAANDNIRGLYAMHDEPNMLRRIWKRLQIRETVLELTAFPPLNPADFSDAKALANKAALDIASVVSPGQTTFEKAIIPSSVIKKKAAQKRAKIKA